MSIALALLIFATGPSLATDRQATNPPADQILFIVDQARQEVASMDSLIDDADRTSVRRELHAKALRLDQLLQQLEQQSATAQVSGGVDIHAGPSGLHIAINTMNTDDPTDAEPVENVNLGAPAQAYSAADFRAVQAAVQAEDFSTGKLALLRSAAADRWFSVDQVRQLVQGLSFGSDKVEAAAILYPHVVDLQNWYLVYDAFDFDSDKQALRDRVGR
ncbi:MAG: DUF4476 domain-containing protein [Oligoflexia bacterium]|nr:DUF4476 domain-containing protein [Oligoflexia bacterium]